MRTDNAERLTKLWSSLIASANETHAILLEDMSSENRVALHKHVIQAIKHCSEEANVMLIDPGVCIPINNAPPVQCPVDAPKLSCSLRNNTLLLVSVSPIEYADYVADSNFCSVERALQLKWVGANCPSHAQPFLLPFVCRERSWVHVESTKGVRFTTAALLGLMTKLLRAVTTKRPCVGLVIVQRHKINFLREKLMRINPAFSVEYVDALWTASCVSSMQKLILCEVGDASRVLAALPEGHVNHLVVGGVHLIDASLWRNPALRGITDMVSSGEAVTPPLSSPRDDDVTVHITCHVREWKIRHVEGTIEADVKAYIDEKGFSGKVLVCAPDNVLVERRSSMCLIMQVNRIGLIPPGHECVMLCDPPLTPQELARLPKLLDDIVTNEVVVFLRPEYCFRYALMSAIYSICDGPTS
ncbi:hypothetical protein DQ04_00111030 [Trypanosoma grayi]|uniref:hypothetical protein n=1 Tax=Trypanosoma grayi TaxID=71804 RepID=UPI0004F4013D|nr:hypothetical protein DQ04_00111030 [Trypanosoma grayi]KEG15303.1 hypothetical protein DQ04_00111030 [Trypanosoma grayi]